MAEAYHPVTHVVFDMDGLLLDTGPINVKLKETILAQYGKELTLELKRAIQGRNGRSQAEQLISALKLPITADEFLAQKEKMNEDAFGEYVPFMPGAERLVRHLKETQVPICIATGSKNRSVELKFQHHGQFVQLFHHVVTGSDEAVKNGKPAPDVFLVAVQRFGGGAPTDMKNVLVFEDSVNGVKAGLAAGMQVVWVPSSISDRTATDATLILSSLDEFKPELFGLPPYK